MTDQFKSAVEAIAAERATNQPTMQNTFTDAVTVNPDQYAKTKSLADRLGLPPAAVETDPQNAERKAKLNGYDFAAFASRSPTAAKFLADPENAKLAWDDANNLDAVEQVVNIFRPFAGLVAAPITSTVVGVQGMRQQVADLFGNKEMSRDALIKAQTAKQIQATIDPPLDGFVETSLYNGLKSLAQQLPALATGNLPVVMTNLAVQAQGEAYTRFRARGGSPLESFIGATGTTATEVATEMLPMKQIVDTFGKVGFGKFLREYLGKELPSEQVATLVQDFIDTVVANPDKTLGDYLRERPEAALSTAIATFASSGALSAASAAQYRLSGEKRKVEEAATNFEAMKQLRDLATASRLRERAPAKFAEFVKKASEAVPTVYVDTTGLAQSGIKPEDLVRVAPSLANQISDIQTGGNIAVPMEEFVTAVLPSQYGEAVLVHSKTDPDGLSDFQSKNRAAQDEVLLQQEVEKILAERNEDDAFAESRARVYDNILGKLTATNRFTADVTKPYANMVANFYTVQAARLGKTPEQVATEYPLDIVAEGLGGLEQELTLPPVDENGFVTLDHFSTVAGLEKTDPEKWGKNSSFLPRDERNRIGAAPGRTYFGIATGQRGGYRKELGLGDKAYRARISADRLYDARKDPLGLREKVAAAKTNDTRTLMERLIKEAGYAGYWVQNEAQGMVAAVFEPLALEQSLAQGPTPDLIDLPREVDVDGAKRTFGAFLPAHRAAEEYMARAGLPYIPPRRYVKVDRARARRIAAEYEKMPNAPQDPEVAAAYEAMIAETLAQYQFIKDTGLVVEFIEGKDPYGNPRNAILDVVENNHLWVFPTDAGFGDVLVNIGMSVNDGSRLTPDEIISAVESVGVKVNEFRVHQSDTEPTVVARLSRALTDEEAAQVSSGLKQEAIAQLASGVGELYGPLAETWRPFNPQYFLDLAGETAQDAGLMAQNPLLRETDEVISGRKARVNDIFRIVHDYFGHIKDGVGFRADGEENAWRSHAAMYSPLARRAMTTETRGQNSWVNFGPYAETNKTASGEETKYAEQKIGLLPEWVSTDGATDGALYQSHPSFVSALQNGVANSKAEKMPADQWLSVISKLPGVKAEEVEWSGIKEFLADKKGSITKREVLDALAANEIRIEEVVKSENADPEYADMPSDLDELYFTHNLNTIRISHDFAEGVTPLDIELREGVEMPGLGGRNSTAVDSGYQIYVGGELMGELTDGSFSYEDGLTEIRNIIREHYESSDAEAPEKILLDTKQSSQEAKSYTYTYTFGYNDYTYEIHPTTDGDFQAVYVSDNGSRANEDLGRHDDLESAKEAIYAHSDKLQEWELAHWEPEEAPTNQTRHESYQLDGEKSDYTELLLTMANQSSNFRVSGHWDESNVLVHTRFNTRTIDGKKTLFLEEIQSDWHQAGRDKGYRSEANAPQVVERSKEYFILQDADGRRIEPHTGEVAWTTREAAEQAARDYVVQQGKPGQVPDAPFKDASAWAGLAFKRMVSYAAENGFEQVAWTTGKQQVDRWAGALRKQVDTIKWEKTKDGVHLIGLWRGEEEVNTKEKENALSDAIGKAMADRILSDPNQSGEITGDDITIDSTGMAKFYDETLVSVANKLAKPFGVKAGITKILGDNAIHVLPLPERLLITAKEGLPLFQGQRGSYNPSTTTIALLKDADLSTFLHETGHFFLDTLAKMATNENAPAEIKTDMDTTLQWFGVSDLATWNAMTLDEQRPYHEQFARGFEAYLFEGKSPSIEMRGMFQRFRAWLLNVYKSLKNLNVELTDDVRGVFDRMIASAEEIKNARAARSLEPMFATQADSGMSDEEWRTYQQEVNQAAQDAAASLENRSIRDMKWLSNARDAKIRELQREARSKRAAVRKEVIDQVRREPVYAAENFIRRGELDTEEMRKLSRDERRKLVEFGLGKTKLDLGALKEMYGEEANAIWRNLDTGKYGLAGADGLHPDTVAEMFGFSSGDELVRALIAAEPVRAKVDGLTDQRMLERYGDLTDERAIREAADEALHNEAHTRFAATELNALNRLTGKRSVAVSMAKQFAANMISRLRVRQIVPSRYVNAETRAAREADRLRRAGNLEAAAEQKRNQLIQGAAARSAYEAKAEVEKGVEYLNKFSRDGVRNNIADENLEQIDNLLDRYDLRKALSLRAIDKRTQLADWINAQAELGIEPDFPPEILDETRRVSYKNLTVEEFRGLVDAVKQIEHIGRVKEKLLVAADKAKFEDARAAVVASINDNYDGKPKDLRTRTSNIGSMLADMGVRFAAMHRKMASMARQMDGWKDGGAVWQYFIRSMNERGAMEARMREEATIKLAELTKDIIQTGKMGGKGKFFPTVQMSLNREERLAIALNMGNLGNTQRLLDGEGWTLEQIQPVLDTLDKKDWDFVQGVWDFFESYRPEIGAKEKRVYGKEPEWVEPHPVNTKFGIYRGGYYPVKYDPARSGRAQQFADAEDAKQMLKGAFTSSTTRRSFTKTRSENVKDRPLLYSFSGIYQGANEIIHDLSWHEWLIDVNRLLRNKSIDGAMRRAYGAETVDLFKTAIRDIAQGEQGAANVFERAINHIRTGATVAGMGWNLSVSLLQPLGLTNSMVRIGTKWVAKGTTEWLKSPIDKTEEVYEKSDMMRLRGKTMQREINEIQNRISGGKSKMQEMVELSYFYTIQKMQIVADMPTWLGQYEKSIAEHGDEVRAVAEADQAVLDAQGGGQVKDLAAIQRGGPLQKLFTNFYSYFNTVYNLGIEVADRTDFKNPAEVVFAVRDYLLLMTVPAALGTLIYAAVDGDDDEDLARDLAADQISQLMGVMVGVREMAAVVQKILGVNKFDTGYSAPAGLRFLAEIDKLGTQVNQGEIDTALRKSLLNVTGIIFHLPTGQINKTWSGLTALLEGRTSNPLALIGGAPSQ